jgi:predicted HNH restriction endonuclease
VSKVWNVGDAGKTDQSLKPVSPPCQTHVSKPLGSRQFGMLKTPMARNPPWTRNELILALELYMRHRDQLPDSDNPEIIELSQQLNSSFGDKAKDTTVFRNPNGVYMKLANFRAVDPRHTAQGKRGLTRGGRGTEKIWDEFSTSLDQLNSAASAIRSASTNE